MIVLTSTGWILLAFSVVTLCLDAFAIWKVFASPFYEPAQRWGQAVLILLVPIFGAYLSWYLAREQVALFQSPPVDHVKDIDPTCSDIDYHG
ncbi:MULTISPECIES: hypothetical protein [Rugamonas]|uniref:Uncharacterized protein n=2 Tax=Rugamonas TaxID=212744 RepID=A0A843S6A2_9BURK|nr:MULTISPECIES: hypothetical protein [Rugamonas]MQA19709.1 hypothetical protein [Rugamonas rivuli]MQA40972.1 hypothetical protein [Rugamonas aquatica]